MNFTHAGGDTVILAPVACSLPVSVSIRKTTTLFEILLATRRKLPLGSMQKFLGHFPPLGSWPAGVSLPVFASMAKIAMLSCPRLDPYRNFPDRWTWVGTTNAAQQAVVQLVIAGDHIAVAQQGVAAAEIRDKSAGFANH